MLKSLSIVQKVWLTAGILIICYLISMVFVFENSRKTEMRLSDVADYAFPAAQMSQLIVGLFKEQIKSYRESVLFGDSSHVGTANKKWREADDYLKAMLDLSGLNDDAKETIRITRKEMMDFEKAAYENYLLISNDIESDHSHLMAQTNERTEALQEQLVLFQQKFSRSLTEELAAVQSKTHIFRWLNMVSFFCVVAISIFLNTMIISRSISRPLKEAIAMVQDVAEGEGDLTKRLPIKNEDELSVLAFWFNTFLENLQKMIQNISATSETLNNASHQLFDLSNLMTASVNQMSEKSNSVSASAEEMNANMASVARTMEQAAANTNMVASSIEEMTATINETAQNSAKSAAVTNEGVDQVKTISIKVGELGVAATEIGKVTETITDISSQTNLLSLNATIEAARAGESGKGFAVVANEIKELANQTADATKDIIVRVDGIQNSANGTVTAIEEITKVITSVNEIVSSIAAAVEQQSTATQEIANNVFQVTRGITEANTNVAESSSVAGHIAEDISDVNQTAKDISESSQQVSVSAENLSALAVELKDMIGKFKLS